MASKVLGTIALVLSMNLLFLSMANAHNQQPKCGKDGLLLLDACANILNVVDVRIGKAPHKPCCDLIKGLAALELDACLCTVVNANVLGLVNVKAPIQLNLLLNKCGMKPRVYRCN